MGEVREDVLARPRPIEVLRRAFSQLTEKYDTRLETDPLRYPSRYSAPLDREAVAFLAAMLAFGNVKVIFRSLDFLTVNFLTARPHTALMGWPAELPTALRSFKHRWVTGRDLHVLFRVLLSMYRDEGSLEAHFSRGFDPSHSTVREGLEAFLRVFRERALSESGQTKLSRGLQFLLSSPCNGSSCKRANLFLRWVVRKDAPDLGLWSTVHPRQLILPLDTHLSRIVRYLGMTQRKTVDWRMAEEVTRFLARLSPDDPTRLDFALSRLGILDDCLHRPDSEKCPRCPLCEICSLNGGRHSALTVMTR